MDGDKDGVFRPCDYQDAIPAAANYLVSEGAPGDYSSAIYAYNHSNRYVKGVFAEARRYYRIYGP